VSFDALMESGHTEKKNTMTDSMHLQQKKKKDVMTKHLHMINIQTVADGISQPVRSSK